jgi:hypothetical protein
MKQLYFLLECHWYSLHLSKLVLLALVVKRTASGRQNCTSSLGCRSHLRRRQLGLQDCNHQTEEAAHKMREYLCQLCI